MSISLSCQFRCIKRIYNMSLQDEHSAYSSLATPDSTLASIDCVWIYCGSSKLLWISLDVTMVIYVYVSIQYSMRYFVPIKWFVKNLWKNISQTRLIRKIVPKGKNWRFRKNHKTIAVCKIQEMQNIRQITKICNIQSYWKN